MTAPMQPFTDEDNLRFCRSKRAELAEVCEAALEQHQLTYLHVQASFASIVQLDKEIDKLIEKVTS